MSNLFFCSLVFARLVRKRPVRIGDYFLLLVITGARSEIRTKPCIEVNFHLEPECSFIFFPPHFVLFLGADPIIIQIKSISKDITQREEGEEREGDTPSQLFRSENARSNVIHQPFHALRQSFASVCRA